MMSRPGSDTISSGLPKINSVSEPEAKTEMLITPALNGATLRRLGERTEHQIAFRPAKTTEGHTPYSKTERKMKVSSSVTVLFILGIRMRVGPTTNVVTRVSRIHSGLSFPVATTYKA